MNPQRNLGALLSLALFVFFRFLPLGAQSSAGGSKVEKTQEAGVEFSIDSKPRGARIEINGDYVGLSPLDLKGYGPGSYSIEISLLGYQNQIHRLNAQAGNRYIIMSNLEARLGILDISVDPPYAQVLIDDQVSSSGRHKLTVGNHSVRARLFGYESQEESVTISDLFSESISFSLEEAEFELSGLSASRSLFNPAGPGILGKSDISFRVSAPGSGRLRIETKDYDLVAEEEYPSFDTWEYGYSWNGRDSQGKILPDGRYSVIVEAEGSDGEPDMAQTIIVLDSTARFVNRDISNGVSGYAHCPDASILPRGGIESRMGLGMPFGSENNLLVIPFWMGMRGSLTDKLEASFAFGSLFGPGSQSGAALSAAVKIRYLRLSKQEGLEAAFYAQGFAALPQTLARLSLGELGSGLKLGFPFSLSFGIFDASLSPYLSMSLIEENLIALHLGGQAAFGLQLPLMDIHLSAKLAYRPLSGEFSQPFRCALDSRLFLGFIPLSVGTGLGLDIYQDGQVTPSILFDMGFMI